MKKLKINEGFLKAFTIILLLVIATLGITLYKKQEEITRTSGKWVDYKNAKQILDDKEVEYSEYYNEKNKICHRKSKWS